MYVLPNIKAPSCNHCCSGKAISIVYSESVLVALFVNNVKRMRLVILTPVACLALLYFSTLSQKRHDFWKEKSSWTHNVCFYFP